MESPRLDQAGPTLLRLSGVVLGLTLAVGLAELTLRLIDPLSHALRGYPTTVLAGPRLPFTYRRAGIDRVGAGEPRMLFDSELGWVPARNFDRLDGDTRYRHNGAGQRAERDYTPTPAPGVRRISAYGDSFTYCEEVDVMACWTQRLEALLPNIEVLNFGTSAYGPDQAWLRYRGGGASWQPCVVLIGHMVENINRVVNRFRPFYQPRTGVSLAKPRFILESGRPTLLPSGVRHLDELRDPSWVEANLGPHDVWYYPGTPASTLCLREGEGVQNASRYHP